MGIKSKAIPVLVAAILFVSAIAGTAFYYNGVVNSGNSKIALMHSNIANLINEITDLNNEIINQSSEIANLNSQISNLNGQVTKLTSPNLVTALGLNEILSNSSLSGTLAPYNHLEISGTVTNMGESTAFNAGLHIEAYDADGTLEINMTVPLDNGASFGTNAATDVYGSSSLQLGNLDSWQVSTISIAIYHEGTVTNWTLTPVWTNSS